MLTYIMVKQIKSCIRQPRKNKLLLKSLGLRKINQFRIVENNKSARSLIRKVHHLLSIKIHYK